MGLTYFKRYRMELDLRGRRFDCVPMPAGYRLLAYRPERIDAHAEAKYFSFRDEIDSAVFSCFSEFDGCRQLMWEISQKDGFLPEATWLVEYIGAGHRKAEYCGTIQAVRTQRNRANIQNIGVAPLHRGRGIGTALIHASLMGLDYVGIPRVRLEVTAENAGAVQLYRRLGFRTIRTLYKTVELAPATPSR